MDHSYFCNQNSQMVVFFQWYFVYLSIKSLRGAMIGWQLIAAKSPLFKHCFNKKRRQLHLTVTA